MVVRKVRKPAVRKLAGGRVGDSSTMERRKKTPLCPVEKHPMTFNSIRGLWECLEHNFIAQPKNDPDEKSIMGRGEIELRLMYIPDDNMVHYCLVADNNVILDITGLVYDKEQFSLNNSIESFLTLSHSNGKSEARRMNATIQLMVNMKLENILEWVDKNRSAHLTK